MVSKFLGTLLRGLIKCACVLPWHESHLAKLQEDGLWVCVRHQLEVLDRGVRHAAPEVEAVGAELLVPLGRLVAHDHSVVLPVAPLVPAWQVLLVRN